MYLNLDNIKIDIASRIQENRNFEDKITSSSLINYNTKETPDAPPGTREIGVLNTDIQKMISKQDGVSIFAQNLARSQARDEHDAVISVIKGVCDSETKPDGRKGGLLDFESNPKDENLGCFIDLNDKDFLSNKGDTQSSKGYGKLFDISCRNAVGVKNLISALGIVYKDYEPDFLYLLVSMDSLSEIKKMNLIDEYLVEEGNTRFQTILQGKFRLFLTREKINITSPIVNEQSKRTTVVVSPESFSFVRRLVDESIKIYPIENDKYEVFHRYNFGIRPEGYRWTGGSYAANKDLENGGYWNRKFGDFNPKIIPIFHR